MIKYVFSAFAYLLGTRKRNADARLTDMKALHEAANIYKQINDELKQMVETLTNKCNELTTELIQLRAENKAFRKQVEHLERTINEMNKK